MTDFYRVDDLFSELKERENTLRDLLSKAKKLTVDYKQSTGLKAYIKIHYCPNVPNFENVLVELQYKKGIFWVEID